MDSREMAERTAKSLRVIRAGLDLSQRAVCRETGIKPPTLSSWEKRAGMTLESAWRLADYYGVSLDELAGRK